MIFFFFNKQKSFDCKVRFLIMKLWGQQEYPQEEGFKKEAD